MKVFHETWINLQDRDLICRSFDEKTLLHEQFGTNLYGWVVQEIYYQYLYVSRKLINLEKLSILCVLFHLPQRICNSKIFPFNWRHSIKDILHLCSKSFIVVVTVKTNYKHIIFNLFFNQYCIFECCLIEKTFRWVTN